MDKRTEIISKLRDAKMSHLTWKSYAHLISKGVLTDASGNITPIVPTMCEFGKWYYREGVVLSRLKSYQDIELPHNKIHETYAQIYSLKDSELKTGFFTGKRKAEEHRSKEIDELLKVMDNYVEIIINNLARLEEDVNNMSNIQIEALR